MIIGLFQVCFNNETFFVYLLIAINQLVCNKDDIRNLSIMNKSVLKRTDKQMHYLFQSWMSANSKEVVSVSDLD